MRAPLVLAVLASIGSSQSAAADPTPPATGQPATVTVTESYRGTIAVVDAIALGIAVPGVIGVFTAEGNLLTTSKVAAVVGGLGYLGVTPLIHDYKQGDRFLTYLSVIWRVGLPLTLAVAGSKLYCGSEPSGCEGSAPTAVAVGAVGVAMAVALDQFASEREVVVPQVAPVAGGATVGVSMRF